MRARAGVPLRSTSGRPAVVRRVALVAMLCLAGCAADAARRGDGAIAIDEQLDRFDPKLVITPLEAGQWALELEIGAVFDPGSAHDRIALADAAHAIEWVSFVVYRPGVRRADSLVRREVAIDTAGVRGVVSPVVYAGVKWIPPGLVEGDEYAMMTIRTRRGVVVRTSALFEEWRGGWDSTRLTLRLSHDRDSLGLHVRRRLQPSRDEFFAGAGALRLALRDASGAIVWSAADSARTGLPRPIRPDRIGDSVALRVGFDGRDARTGGGLAPGRYILTGEVSAMPRPYYIHEEIDWGGR